jgi:hypothetical protein
MRTRILILAALVLLSLTACHGKSDQSDVKSKVATAASNPQNQAAEQAAQAKVASCLPKGNILTKTGRQAIETCVAPADQQQALKACVLSAAAHEHLATKAGRQRFEQVDLPNCVVKVQKAASK